MTRDDLIRVLVDRQGHVPYKTMCSAVKNLIAVMSQAMSNGHRIEIRGFGSFAVRSRAARLARNPRTGEIVQTAHKFGVHFKPGKELRERVNNAQEVIT